MTGCSAVASTSPNYLAASADAYLQAELCVLPANRLRKYPTPPTWREFQQRRPTKDEIDEWFTAQVEAMCIVCGVVSGNLEVIDFDAKGEKYEAWRAIVAEHAPGLLDRLVIERSPSGGYHVAYRCESPVAGSSKLAERRIEVSGPDEITIDGKRYKPRQDRATGKWFVTLTLIETRGEGGLFLCAPSPGYELIQGQFTALPTITAEERQILLACASELTEVPPQLIDAPRATSSNRGDGNRPGDEFNERGDIREVLVKHGWEQVRGGENEYWRRPGKVDGWSATLKRRIFYVHSSNAAPFEERKAYSFFAVYTLLEHAGDYSAAASTLRESGFGATSNGTKCFSGRSAAVADEAAPRAIDDQGTHRPVIMLSSEEHRIIDEAVESLRSEENLYHRGSKLVRVVREPQRQRGASRHKGGLHRPEGSAFIQLLPAESLRERLTACSQILKRNAKGKPIAAHPTPWLVNGILARAVWPTLRPLTGISHSPILRSDGTIHQEPGYDPETGVLFLPQPGVTFHPIHAEVTLEDAQIARDELLEVVCDFPIASQAHRAVWLAAVLTPFARHAFDGCTPLTLVDANIRGSGKTLLVQATSLIALGRPVSVSAYAHDQAEMQKRITAIAIAGEPIVLLDNLSGTFGNGALDRAITSTRWQDRVLGRNENIDLPLSTIWLATGNNVEIAADTSRRLVHLRLDCLLETPEERSGFRNPDLLQWIAENRPRLVVAALTILRAFFNAGCPQQKVPAFGSFEGWSSLVRQVVIWVGMPDPCITRAALAETSDSVMGTLRHIMGAWVAYDPQQHGVSAAELLGRLYPPQREQMPMDEPAIELRAAIESFVACQPGKPPTPRSLGRHLTVARRRVVDGQFIDMVPNTPKGSAKRWRVVATTSETDCHDSPDSVSIPFARKDEVDQ